MSDEMIEKYEEMVIAMNEKWPLLKEKLLTGDKRAFGLMEEYYDAFLEYDAVMNDRKGELRRLDRAYGKLLNYLHGPICRVEE